MGIAYVALILLQKGQQVTAMGVVVFRRDVRHTASCFRTVSLKDLSFEQAHKLLLRRGSLHFDITNEYHD